MKPTEAVLRRCPSRPIETGCAAKLLHLLCEAAPVQDQLRCAFEARFRRSFGALRISVSPGPALIGASAYACRDAIVIEPHAFRPDTDAGMALLLHEVAHVVQQANLPRACGALAILADPVLEREADDAAAGGSAPFALSMVTETGPVLQCQATGNMSAFVLPGSLHPPGGNITFAASNSVNEVHPDRDTAFNRAKELLGLSPEQSRARRTYHFWTGVSPMRLELGEGESIRGNRNMPLGGGQAAQRTGRYYDFGLGKLIVEHPDDPHSWLEETATGEPVRRQCGHFHCCEYDVASGSEQSMYMAPDGGTLGFRQVAGGPRVYRQARQFTFEMPGGGETGHHIYHY